MAKNLTNKNTAQTDVETFATDAEVAAISQRLIEQNQEAYKELAK